MEKITHDKIKQLARNCMFELSDKEVELISSEFDIFLQQIDLLSKINTDGIEPMDYPFESAVSFLRDDEEVSELLVEEVLANGPDVVDNFFVVPKVVK